jgi:hypothetical protein
MQTVSLSSEEQKLGLSMKPLQQLAVISRTIRTQELVNGLKKGNQELTSMAHRICTEKPSEKSSKNRD